MRGSDHSETDTDSEVTIPGLPYSTCRGRPPQPRSWERLRPTHRPHRAGGRGRSGTHCDCWPRDAVAHAPPGDPLLPGRPRGCTALDPGTCDSSAIPSGLSRPEGTRTLAPSGLKNHDLRPSRLRLPPCLSLPPDEVPTPQSPAQGNPNAPPFCPRGARTLTPSSQPHPTPIPFS